INFILFTVAWEDTRAGLCQAAGPVVQFLAPVMSCGNIHMVLSQRRTSIKMMSFQEKLTSMFYMKIDLGGQQQRSRTDAEKQAYII
ncbi:hypothetical protein AF388_24050, partial [Salmonella enterica subsp. enterica serovar Typhimurium]